jgi:hypothetical protein
MAGEAPLPRHLAALIIDRTDCAGMMNRLVGQTRGPFGFRVVLRDSIRADSPRERISREAPTQGLTGSVGFANRLTLNRPLRLRIGRAFFPTASSPAGEEHLTWNEKTLTRLAIETAQKMPTDGAEQNRRKEQMRDEDD